ncbi:MAG: TonB-dependent receptor, partial [Pseudomonadota bacterium]
MTRLFLNSGTALALSLASLGAAQAQQAIPIDIDAQPLPDALAELTAETGLQVTAASLLIESKESTQVNGVMTPKEALALMLQGTGLTLRSLGEDGAAVTGNVVSQNANDEPFDLGTLVVRGELIERTAQESQTSAVIISGEEIEARGETNLEQVFARTPGVVSGGSQGDISIRGIQTDGPTGVGGGRAITTTIDDIRLAPSQTIFGSSALSTWDLEQVEILRGPQSTQSGRNALAGAVRLISNDPAFEDEYRFRVGLGNNSSSVLSFVLNTPMVEDRLAFRLAFDQEQTNGSARNITLGTDDALFVDQTTIRASLRFDPTDRLSTVLKYTFIDEERGAQSLFASDFPPDRVVRADTQSTFSRTIEGLGLNIAYEINEQWTLQSRTTLTEYEHEDISDAD